MEGCGIPFVRFFGWSFWNFVRCRWSDVSNICCWGLNSHCFSMIGMVLNLLVGIYTPTNSQHEKIPTSIWLKILYHCQSGSHEAHSKSRWWFPYLGKWSILTNMFQMGWNRHLAKFKQILSLRFAHCGCLFSEKWVDFFWDWVSHKLSPQPILSLQQRRLSLRIVYPPEI